MSVEIKYDVEGPNGRSGKFQLNLLLQSVYWTLLLETREHDNEKIV